jgi:hypothetical protein
MRFSQQALAELPNRCSNGIKLEAGAGLEPLGMFMAMAIGHLQLMLRVVTVSKGR